jgi:hypothetical protein
MATIFFVDWTFIPNLLSSVRGGAGATFRQPVLLTACELPEHKSR